MGIVLLTTSLLIWLLLILLTVRQGDQMATIEDVLSNVDGLANNLGALDAKLDEIKSFIASLQVGSVVTQEQLDSLNDVLSSLKTKSEEVLSETDALDEPTAEPTPSE